MLTQKTVAQTAGVNIEVKKGTVKINGKKFKNGAALSMANVESALGKADRTKEGYNRLHTYDKLGLVFFENTSKGEVSEVQVFFKKDSNDYIPNQLFTGTFKVEKLKIDNTTSLAKTVTKLKKYAFKKSLLADNSYRGEYNYIYIFTKYNDGDSATDKISFGFKK